MPATAPRVSLSGTLLASLLQSMSTKNENAEAFLFGTVKQVTVLQATDEREDGEVKTTIVSIQEFQVLPGTFAFYNGAGKVDGEALLRLLGGQDKAKTFVGWLRFRRNTPTQPSLREIAIVEALRPYAAREQQVGPLLALFTHGRKNVATHTIDFAFMWAGAGEGGSMQRAQVDIGNLVESTQAEYKFVSNMPLSSDAPFAVDLLKTLQNIKQKEYIASVEGVRDQILKDIEKKVQKLTDWEVSLQTLKGEVAQLEREAMAAGRARAAHHTTTTTATTNGAIDNAGVLVDVDDNTMQF